MSYEETIIGSGEPIKDANLVEFTLLYQGELLPSSNTKNRTEEKHAIRKALHPQLRRLWSVKSGLTTLARMKGVEAFGAVGEQVPNDLDARFDNGIKSISKNWNRAGFDFVPLVTERFTLRCSVDILLLRPEEEKYIFKQGDIDGQLKTLFDALRIPKDAGEANHSAPDSDEHPLFVLLEDDRLISEVHVVTDQLLLLPGTRETKANDAFAVMSVKLNHVGGSPFDRWFD
jgi:hypothetical protein